MVERRGQEVAGACRQKAGRSAAIPDGLNAINLPHLMAHAHFGRDRAQFGNGECSKNAHVSGKWREFVTLGDLPDSRTYNQTRITI